MFHLTAKDVIEILEKELGVNGLALRNISADVTFANAVAKALWEKIPAGCTPDSALKLHAQVMNLTGALEVMANGRDAAYEERNRLVRFIACVFPSGIRKTEIEGWDAEWQNCVYVDTPNGQMSWHYHDEDAEMFANLPPYDKPWDGHTTAQKYERLAALIADVVPAPKEEPPAQSEHHCAHCNAVLDQPINRKGHYEPKAGDAAFCFVCGNVSMFDAQAPHGMRLPNEPELEALSVNEGLLRMRDIWLANQDTSGQSQVH